MDSVDSKEIIETTTEPGIGTGEETDANKW